MNRQALNHAGKAIEKAKRAAKRIERAADLPEAIDAWEDFLGAVSRTYEKLKAGARGDPKCWTWFCKVQDMRREDELLCYIHHARNSDHHRFEEVVIPKLGYRFSSTGRMRLYGLGITDSGILWVDWKPEDESARPVFAISGPHLHLAAVIDRGVRYEPPASHLGQPLRRATVPVAVSLTIAYLEELEREAASYCS